MSLFSVHVLRENKHVKVVLALIEDDTMVMHTFITNFKIPSQVSRDFAWPGAFTSLYFQSKLSVFQ